MSTVHRKEIMWGGRKLVMETGKIAMAGPARDLLQDRRIREAYLGA